MKINPVLKNEGKLAVRTWKFPMMILVYILLIGGGGIFLLKVTTARSFFIGLSLRVPIQIYLALAIVQAIILLFMVPSMCSTVISSEKERQTLEVLLSTKMSTLSIIIGKLFSSVSKVLILIFVTLPIYGLCFLIGGVNMKNIFEMGIFLVITTFFVGSIGIFFSTMLKSSKAATAATYATVLFIFVGLLIVGIIVYNTRLSSAAEGIGAIYPSFPILSPIIGFLSLLVRQVGESNIIIGPLSMIQPILSMNNFNNAVYMTAGIQIVITVALILISSYKLNPIKGGIKFKRKK